MVVAEFDMHDGKHVVISRNETGGLRSSSVGPDFCVTVNGTLVQEGDAEDMIRYLANHAENAYHLANKVGRIVYQVRGYCPTEPDNCTLEKEDGGAALIFQPCFETQADQEAKNFRSETEYGMFVRVQSYDERVWPSKGADPNAHEEIRRLFGKRVQVTVEVLDD